MKRAKGTLLNNLFFVFKSIRVKDKWLLLCYIFSVMLSTSSVILTTVIPSLILFFVENYHNDLQLLMLEIVGVCSAKIIIDMIESFLMSRQGVAEHKMTFYYIEQIYSKMMDLDYFMLENPQIKNKCNKAEAAVSNNHTAFIHMADNFIALLVSVLKLVFFCMVIISLNPLIIFALCFSAGCEYLAMLYVEKYEYRTRESRIEVGRKIEYLLHSSSDYKAAKDIRLFGLKKWMDDLMSLFVSQKEKLQKDVLKRKMCGALMDLVVITLRDGGIYFFLISKFCNGDISVAKFLLYITVTSQFADVLGEIVMKLSRLSRGNYEAKDFREFIDIQKSRTGKLDLNKDGAKSIELESVCYRYSGASEDTIHNFSLKIEKGEKIALVGLNGAGKTTLVKLICGMYIPTSGSIKIDGVNVNEYKKNDYYGVISSVFQDISVLPFSVSENVYYEQFSEDEVWACIRKAGLFEKIRGLKKGLNTRLVRNVCDEAVDFSGGEIQKLALGRAIYKDSGILVLDEPTSALDPCAEEKMYEIYDKYSMNHTSIFISHRLSSTRFCDRIILLNDGQIKESGTHKELMTKNGMYAKLFTAQQKYYIE